MPNADIVNRAVHKPFLQDPAMSKSIDAAGAGRSWTSPGWLTQLNMLWGGKSVSHSLHTSSGQMGHLSAEILCRLRCKHAGQQIAVWLRVQHQNAGV